MVEFSHTAIRRWVDMFWPSVGSYRRSCVATAMRTDVLKRMLVSNSAPVLHMSRHAAQLPCSTTSLPDNCRVKSMVDGTSRASSPK